MTKLVSAEWLTVSSVEVVSRLQSYECLQGVQVGFLGDHTGFVGVAHIIYLVAQKDGMGRGEPFGNNACLVVSNRGELSLELSQLLHQFWEYWERDSDSPFASEAELVNEVSHFLITGELLSPEQYIWRDGARNERLHRTVRSIEKCKQLRQVFGYRLTASEA